MPGPAAILREIHRLGRYAHDLQEKAEQGPRQLRVKQLTVEKTEEALRQEQEGIKRLKVATHEKEVSLKTARQKIAKYEKQLHESITSKKEYDALKSEIAQAQKEIGQLEDEVLGAMMQTEERTAKLPALEKAVQQAKAELAAYQRTNAARQEGLVQEREQTLRQLAEVVAGLPEEVREQYQRLANLRGPDALTAVQGRSCTACYTEITSQNYNDLKRELFVPCKTCGRFLYLAE